MFKPKMMSLLPISPKAPWLAPLAGYSDLPFRLLCREYGAACAVTEMVSAKGLIYQSPGTNDLLDTCGADTPLVVQIFGSEPQLMARAVDLLLERGFEQFNLNAGCPVPKVAKTGAGAALLKDPRLLAGIVRAMVKQAGPGRVGVKLRAGAGSKMTDFITMAQTLEDEGAAWLALHPRFAAQGYSGQADWPLIAELKTQVSIPVLASGDLFTPHDAQNCLEKTSADAVMFARGALRNPAIFKHYLNYGRIASVPTGQDVAELIRRHMNLIHEYGRPSKALLRMRTILPRYVRNLAGAGVWRQAMASCHGWDHFEDILGQIAQARPSLDAPQARENLHVGD